jgi:L-alanine-DL-glutamate epimerase-like enolase superfamily enzyme
LEGYVLAKIERIELFHVSIPAKKPFYPSWIPGFPQQHNRFTLIKLYDTDGYTGISAGSAMEHERQGLGSLLGPYLIGLDPDDIPTVSQRLREASFLGWRNNWLEAAFWDIKAKRAGKPLYQLLANDKELKVDEVQCYASSGEVRPIETRLPYLDDIREQGFPAVKIRVHSFDEKDDIQIVKDVRREVGDDFGLMVDANQAWRVTLIDDAPLWDLERATRFGKVCDELGVRWIEEPLDMYAYDDYGELCRRIETPISGAELNQGWHEFKTMLEHDSFDIYQPDSTFSTISDVQKLMQACRERNLGFSPHTWTNGIGFLINLQVYAAWEKPTMIEFPYEPPGWIPEMRDGILTEPIMVDKQGKLQVPQQPGIGINIDERKLSKYGKRFYKMTTFKLAIDTIRTRGLKTALELKKKKEAKQAD